MSYFGISGPAQDGGFIAGIGAGAARLNNARAVRAKHAKKLAGMTRHLGNTVDVSNPGPIPAYQMKPSISQFLQLHGVMLTQAARDRLALKDENNLIPQFYVDVNDINLYQVNYMIREEYKAIYDRVARENPGQSDANIKWYATVESKKNIRTTYLVPLFKDAGYDADDAESLSVRSTRPPKAASPYAAARAAVETAVYNPGEEEAVAEYVFKQGIPKNKTQTAVFGAGALLVGYLYFSRRAQRRAKTSKGALYGVFS